MNPIHTTLVAVAALAAAGKLKKRGSRNTDDVYIRRGTIRIGDDETLKVKKLGKGMFTVAYVTTDLPTPRVFLEVNDDRGGDQSKAALSDIYDGDDTNVHIPKVQRVGYTANKTVYEMPLYNAPLRKGNSPKAWEQYKVLKKCWDQGRHQLGKRLGFYEVNNPYNGYKIMDSVVECAERNPEMPESLLDALQEIKVTIANYGSEYSFEFSPRNLATDDDGNLILLDTTYSLLSVQQRRRRR